MAGTKAGGMKTRAKNLAKNPNYYRDLGRVGGAVKGKRSGFASMTPERRIELGRKGGSVRGENYKRSKLKGQVWNEAKNPSYPSSPSGGNSKTKTAEEALQALLDETQAINRGEKSNNYETVTVKVEKPFWYKWFK